MITDPSLSPSRYEDATEENPFRDGVNAVHYDRELKCPGWETYCDGMPSYSGCGRNIEHARPYTRFGWKRKPSGWLLIYGADDDGTDDKRIVLAFCPSCAEVVEQQRRIVNPNPYRTTDHEGDSDE